MDNNNNITTGTIDCSDIEVDVKSNSIAVTEGTQDLEVTVNRKEYSIVGDEVYIPKLYDDAPQWMKDLVQSVVDITSADIDSSIRGGLLESLSQFATSYVPLNQYTESIISNKIGLDGRLDGIVNTLNTTIAEAQAQAIEAALTEASNTYAKASSLNTLSAQFIDNSALVATIQEALATETLTRSSETTALESTLEDLDTGIQGTATAVDTINTYVGIDEAGASTGTGLSGYLEDPTTGEIGGADSQLSNTIRVTSEEVESKWEYGSIVNINGVYKVSGFGLTTNYTNGSGTEANPYNSEFWIDASKLKFTNSNVTGQVAPFTIDASGLTPQITFNGNVEFSNVNGGQAAVNSSLTAAKDYTDLEIGNIPAPNVDGDISANNDVFAQAQGFADFDAMASAYAQLSNTIINGGYINTGLIQANAITADQINTTGLVADTIQLDSLTVLTDAGKTTGFGTSVIADVSSTSSTITSNFGGVRAYNDTAVGTGIYRFKSSIVTNVVISGATESLNGKSYTPLGGFYRLSSGTNGVTIQIRVGGTTVSSRTLSFSYTANSSSVYAVGNTNFLVTKYYAPAGTYTPAVCTLNVFIEANSTLLLTGDGEFNIKLIGVGQSNTSPSSSALLIHNNI